MDRRNGAADTNGALPGPVRARGNGSWGAALCSWLVATSAVDEEDRRRELALNWIVMASVLLAFFEAAIRAPSVIEGGAAASDHGPTMVVGLLAGIAFSALLVLSRRGRQVLAAWGLLGAYYAVIAWLFAAEGAEESAAIVLCTMMVVTGGVLLGTRVSMSSVLLITATALIVDSLDHAGVIHLPAGHDAPSVLGQLGICGGLAALAVVLSARTVERRGSVGELLSGGGGGAPVVSNALVTTLTVRELQIVRLIAAGRSNDQIARELFLSPRTVHTHVSNALRKAGCANRTELAVLAIHDGVAPAPARTRVGLGISTGDT